MFLFFSNRLGCLGSLLLSLALTAVLILLLYRWVPPRSSTPVSSGPAALSAARRPQRRTAARGWQAGVAALNEPLRRAGGGRDKAATWAGLPAATW